MKTRREIRRILTEELGFHSLDHYRAWIANERPKLRLNDAYISRLSPDEIDNRDFWRVCEEIFGRDPICNVALRPAVGKLPYEIDSEADANRMNLRLARSLGITAFLEENANLRVKTLEIGPGFGSLKHYIETHTVHHYRGIDTFPRIPGVIETTADGMAPRELVETEAGTYSYVISSNVFQHLSAKQRSAYYADAHKLLHRGGLFVFNLLVDTELLKSPLRDESGRAWCDHYGQCTLIGELEPLEAELTKHFEILYRTRRYDSLHNFVCRKP